MKTLRPGTTWLVPSLLALGLAVLYSVPLRTGFLNDDYLFLEEARSHRLVDSLGRLGALGNYYRPLSRQIYFEWLSPIAGGSAAVFHLAQFALFLGTLVLLAELLAALLPPTGVLVATLYFALLPFQRLALTWVSCSQDLLALLFGLGAFALHRRGRPLEAALVFLCAAASKESALPLPVLAFAWDRWIGRRSAREALRRAAPLGAVTIGWVALSAAMRGAAAHGSDFLRISVSQFAAGWVHELQSLLGLDHPAGWFEAMARSGPALIPLVLLAAAVWIGLGRPAGAGEAVRAQPRPRADETRARPGARAVATFALTWLLAFGAVTGPVAHTWSSYYYMFAAVGGALLVGLAARRIDRVGALALTAALLWWNAGGAAVRTFAVADTPWGWTSHLTSYYFERASALTDTLGRQLRALEPRPAPGTRFFFATLPPWAGFQMGSGALIRTMYRDPTLGSWFYSQFSESTAAEAPCRFLYWDGERLRPLYPGLDNPFFQVGADLLLLDRTAGAAHAFRRGLTLATNPADRSDLLYWLGWTEMWQGHREQAESAWLAFGAHDDSLDWSAHLREAHNALVDGDSLASRRQLAMAIRSGIGRPEAHAVLGELLLARQPKYAMMELSVATWLKPADWVARRALVLALFDARLDPPASRHLERLKQDLYGWEKDPRLAHADSVLGARARNLAPVAVPTPTRRPRS